MQQNWNGATILFVWSTTLLSVEPWQDKRAKNSYTERKSYTRMPREAVRTTWNEVERRKKFSPGASILFSTECKRRRLTEKVWTVERPVLRPVLRLKQEIPCLWRARWKISSYRLHPVCRGYKSGNRCIHDYRCLCRQADGKSNLSARSRRRYSRISCYLVKKTSKVVYLKTQRQWILFYGKLKNWDWTLRRDTPEIPRMHLVQNWIWERKRQSGGGIPKRWTSWAKSLRARFWGTTTWGNVTTSRLYQQSSVEFAEKLNYVWFFCEGARDTEYRMLRSAYKRGSTSFW